MLRLFDKHFVRKQKELDGMWKFIKSDGKEYNLPVPGCWEQHPELLTYRGSGTYYKKVYIQDVYQMGMKDNKSSAKKEALVTRNIRLEFKGVSHTADVYFDDEFVTHHYNAFTGFSGIIKNVTPGEHIIKVHVDNSFSEKSSLHLPNDYYTYGGIIRPVAMEELGDVFIENVHFNPYKLDGKWMGHIKIKLKNISLQDQHKKISFLLAGNQETEEVEIKAGESRVMEFHSVFNGVEEWCPKSPNLYFLETTLYGMDGKIEDDYIERVGFRVVRTVGNKIMVNEKPVFLKGFNRHEDYAILGSSIPFQLMVKDMDLMQELGSNAVRTCHYPNDERFLDLCDERGMMVWEENHARGLDLKRMQNPNFEEQCKDCIDEMIEEHYNHPSLVIWGILNECASETVEGREIYKKQYDQIKSLDLSRPTTSATCRHFTDICLDLPDIVSFNIYSGWYEDVDVKSRHERQMEWISSTGGQGKPVIVSEFGGGGIYGYRDRGRAKWSEERQADIIRENLEVYREDDRLSGVFIWQFCDCKVTQEEWFAVRPRSYNNKGVVDEYRRPKEAFDVVKEIFPTMK